MISNNYKIAVIGTGLMAHGIVQEFAQAGCEILMIGRSQKSVNNALTNITENLENLQKNGIISQSEIRKTFSRIHTGLSIEIIPNDTDIVIESVLEDLDLKQSIFLQLENVCSDETIITSNTSSYPPSRLSDKMRKPERFMNTHYFNPPYLIPLIEIVKSEKTDEKLVLKIFDMFTKMGKIPIVLRKEFPGFIANRLQVAMLREALYVVENGVADAADVDTVIKNSIGRRWAVAGVFEVCELAGLDLFMKIAYELQPTLNSSIEVSKLLVDKVEKGETGAKSGMGFYKWTPELVAIIKNKIAQQFLSMRK